MSTLGTGANREVTLSPKVDVDRRKAGLQAGRSPVRVGMEGMSVNRSRLRHESPLYRESKGHGGIYCEGCHDSTHAVATSRETNDTIKFLQLQGHSGTLRDCTVCHFSNKPGMFKHME